MYDNVPMAKERTLADYRGGVLLMNPEGFDGQKDMFYCVLVHLLNGRKVLQSKVGLHQRGPARHLVVLQRRPVVLRSLVLEPQDHLLAPRDLLHIFRDHLHLLHRAREPLERGMRLPVRDDMSPEAGLRYTPVNTSPRRFDNDGYSLRANGLPDGVCGGAAAAGSAFARYHGLKQQSESSPLCHGETGGLVTVEIDPEDSIAPIPNKMQCWLDIPEHQRGQQRLAYPGVPLEDGMALGDYDVPFDGMLDLEEPFMVYVQFPEGDPGVSKTKDVFKSESCGIVPSPPSAGVNANVLRRDGNVGPINKAKGRGFIQYNTVNEHNAEIEHFVHTISAFAVLLWISFLITGYAMGTNAIHSTVANVPEGLLLICLTLHTKRKRMLATNRDGVETIRCISCTSTFTNVLLCVLLFPHHVCKQ